MEPERIPGFERPKGGDKRRVERQSDDKDEEGSWQTSLRIANRANPLNAIYVRSWQKTNNRSIDNDGTIHYYSVAPKYPSRYHLLHRVATLSAVTLRKWCFGGWERSEQLEK
jgi:hypothetical protein